ncbi:MAG: class I SAM-dependent methyltransferase [Actinomycetota bacterium]
MTLADLIAANPWPAERPDVPAVDWGWGVEGAELLTELVDPSTSVILEIGSLLGGSARFWASHCPDAVVLCVDPWIDVAQVSDRPFLEHVPELVDVLVGRVDGMLDVFLASNWELRDRIIPLRGFSPDRLASVHAAGVQPDVVYVDGSHVYEDVIADLSAARAMFPDALICGDDYDWPAVAGAVDYVVANRGDRLKRHGNTFAIEQTGAGGRHGAPSAKTTAPAERSLPVRVAAAVAAELPVTLPDGVAKRLG